MAFDFNKRTAQYVQLRDMIKAQEAADKEKLKPLKETLEKLNSLLLGHLQATGQNSAASESGTVYRSEKKSASIADMNAFWKHVVTQGDWDLLDKKANVKAVEDFVIKTGGLPPGVNFSTTLVVGVRRA